MQIFMACPAPATSRKGNRVTADRWAAILAELGHRLVTDERDPGFEQCDLLIALHARKSYPAVARWRKLQPARPLIVALTGTDLYHDIRTSKRAQKSLELADRLILLQPDGAKELPARLRPKTRVIFQSVEPVGAAAVSDYPRANQAFRVAVLGHLRHEKDPLRTALALRQLPADLRIEVTHLGQALSASLERQARRLMDLEPRYRWLGEVPRAKARRTLARSHLMVLSSRMEGGANVLSEAIADAVPVLASGISGSVGILGKDYPGFFPVGDTEALARLLNRTMTDQAFYARLKDHCLRLKPLVEPAREQAAWHDLLAEFLSAVAD
jgi:putative glycosyltransferase (TIGR04348 family)